MKPLSVLIFDDARRDLEEVGDAFNDYWEEIRKERKHIPPLDITRVQDPAQVRELFKDLSKTYSIFVCDILVQTSEEQPQRLGIPLINLAKSQAKVPVVIGVSMGPKTATEADFTQRINESKVDFFVSKQSLLDGRGREAIEKAMHLLDKHGLVAFQGQIEFDEEVGDADRMAGIISIVGEPTLLAIASRLAPGAYKSVVVSALRPGLSGAHVLRADFKSETEDLSARPVLIKISNTPEKLDEELDNYNEFVRRERIFPDRLVVPFIRDEVLQIGGWDAIGAHFSTHAKTLLNWITDNPSGPEDIENVFSELFFNDGLSTTYAARKEASPKTIPTALFEDQLSNFRILSIKAALTELSHLITKHACDSTSNLSELRTFLISKRIGAIDESKLVRKKTLRVFSHRDLHAGNILIETLPASNRPKVIDYANLGQAAWPIDISRLIVDLALSGLNGDEHGYEWNILTNWQVIVDLVVGERLPQSESAWTRTARHACAISWLQKNLFKICPVDDDSVSSAEFMLALTIEFMRSSYRKTELPPPVRALALVAASATLKKAEEFFER